MTKNIKIFFYSLKIIPPVGGNIGYRSSQDTYYYGSTSFGSARKVIKYFDQYHLQSTKHINYLKWRKAYLIIQDKNHLNELGLNKIIKLKMSPSGEYKKISCPYLRSSPNLCVSIGELIFSYIHSIKNE